MLILMPRYMLDCPTINVADKSDTLENLFDIGLGLIEDRFLHLTKEKKEPVYFLTAKSFVNVPNKTREDIFLHNSLEQLNVCDPVLIKKIQSGEMATLNYEKDKDEKGNLNEQKGYIKESRLLQNHDFLISIRGEPKGYSLIGLPEIGIYNFVTTNYFVRLSPRSPANFHMEYLHLIVNQFVKHKLVERFQALEDRVSGNKKKTYASFNSFSIEDLKLENISYHSSIKEQMDIMDEYKKQFDKWHLQRLVFNQFEYNIYCAITNQPHI